MSILIHSATSISNSRAILAESISFESHQNTNRSVLAGDQWTDINKYGDVTAYLIGDQANTTVTLRKTGDIRARPSFVAIGERRQCAGREFPYASNGVPLPAGVGSSQPLAWKSTST